MSISTYSELKTAIADHLHRTDLTSYIPDFIKFAESVISNDPRPTSPDVLPGIRTRDQDDRVTTTLSTEYIDTPTNMLGLRKIKLVGTPDTKLDYLSPEEMTRKYPSSTTGTPKYYTIHGDEFQFRPIPDTSYTLEITYFAKYAAFSASTDTNWLLTNHPLIYVYAAMIAASAYTEDDPTKWAALYKTLASGLNGTEEKGRYAAHLSTRISTATP
jgi:hypothetical protein